MSLKSFERSADIGTILEALRCDGAVIVKDLVEPGLVDTIRTELRPRFDEYGTKSRSDFNGSRTLRCSSGVLSGAPSAVGLVDHDMLVSVANSILLPHCATYQIGSMSAIEILPGESAQALHPSSCVAVLTPVDR